MVLILLAMVGCYSDANPKIDGIAAGYWKEGEPGFSVAVVHKGKLVFKKG